MRKLLGCGSMIVLLVGAYFFIKGWSRVTSWGTGTGSIARQMQDRTEAAGEAAGKMASQKLSQLQEVARDPRRFKGQRKTVTGRVRSVTRIASNRNMYLLVEGDDRILVIDDKAPPKAYYKRTVTGVVQNVAEVGGRSYAYMTDVKGGVRIDPPSLNQMREFFVDKFEQVREGVDQQLADVKNR